MIFVVLDQPDYIESFRTLCAR